MTRKYSGGGGAELSLNDRLGVNQGRRARQEDGMDRGGHWGLLSEQRDNEYKT